MAENKSFSGVCGLELTDIKVYPFKEGVSLGHIRGLAQITFNNALVVRGLRIMQGTDGDFFVSYPLDPFYKGEDYKNVVIPEAPELRAYVQEEVLARYKALADLG